MDVRTRPAEVPALAARLPGKVVLPGDAAYETARLAWNLRATMAPEAIVYAETPDDVSEALAFAREQDLRVAVQATGHRVTVDGRGCLVINTSRMKALAVDPAAARASVGAGVKWGAVLAQAQAHGLAPLLGSSGDVGAVGYTLGGGLGWLARKYGMSVDSVLRFEVVTADGRARSASPEEHPDLFWALRGGGGGFGVVTGMEIRLHPVARVYAGNLFYPAGMAKEVWRRYREWVAHAPDELTSSIVLMNVPPLPQVPPALRGQSFVIVRGCYLGASSDGEALLAYWRNWQAPAIDEFREMSFIQADQISQDPVDPIPALNSGEWLRDLSDETADALIGHTFPQGGPPLLVFNEVRLAGGAIARIDPATTAYSHRDEKFIWVSIALGPSEEAAHAVRQQLSRLRTALGPARTGRVYMNFLEGEEMRERTRDGFSEAAFRRLQAVKARYDGEDRIISGFDIPPATTPPVGNRRLA